MILTRFVALAGILAVSAHGAGQPNPMVAAGTPDPAGAYLYTPTEAGIHIMNGKRRFNRPLYTAVERPHRIVALAGDRPDFMLIEMLGKGGMFKLANFKVGLAGGTWLSEIEPVSASYDKGVHRYRIGEGDSTILLNATRAQGFDGLLLRLRRSAAAGAPLVFAMGARAYGGGFANQGADPESVPAEARLSPEQCKETRLDFSGNVLTLSGEGGMARIPIHATGSVPLEFKACDPAMVENGPDALLTSAAGSAAVGLLTANWPSSGEIFFILTPDDPGSAAVEAFLANPDKVFTQAVEDNRAVADTIQIDTPDPYLNAILPAALLSYNATWNDPVFCHGAVSWHSEYAGWRNTYGATSAGWHDRVQTHMAAFFAKQSADGRIPSMLATDEIYNMGEVLVDQALRDWEWTGDLDPLREGGFDAIARHLDWGEKNVKTPDGLYENFLNAWNTDYKWCNGGGGTIASVYYWRANQTMADIATRLGRDPAVFQQRAIEIAAAMKSRLWSERAGVYGEYRDRFGHQLLHESPDLSSIYTPIQLGFCDPFESYRMLRFALRRFGVIDGLPRDGKLIYSSEILPNHYSTRGLYPQEIIDALHAMYLIGDSEAAEPFRRGIDGSFFAGPGPGSTGLGLLADGRYDANSAIDFTDPVSLYLRNVVEGLFGIRMDAPGKRIVIQPSFPLSWDRASIQSPAASYEYARDGQAETLRVTTPRPLETTIRLRARHATIERISVNGKPVTHTIEPGIGHAWLLIEVPGSREPMRVNVEYGSEALPVVEAPSTAAPGAVWVVTAARGRITEIRDSAKALSDASISADGRQLTARLPGQDGFHTFFAKVEHGDVRLWWPLEVELRTAVESTPVPDDGLTAVPVKLNGYYNQRLADLHKNSYGPRIEEFPWVLSSGFGITEGTRTVKANGRSWWEGHGKNPSPDTSLLEAAGGRLVSKQGIPFEVPASGKNAVFTSLYDNFPDQVEIPVRMRGRKIHFLLAASISTAQSRMENARITVVLGDGKRQVLSLRDPENIDDWLGSGSGNPYVLTENVLPLGKLTHAVLNEVDLGAEKEIQSVILETRTNETMVGLLGMTVMRQAE